MGKADRISERQLNCLIFVSLLSPMIRVLPRASVLFAGRAAWVSPIAAYAVGRALLALTRYLRKNAPEGVGLQDMAMLGLGRTLGRIFGLVTAAWLIFYGGFVARSAAERLLATVYPNGSSTIFVAVLLLAALIPASGLTKTLARAAEVLMPILAAVIALVLVSAVQDITGENLLPVTYRDSRRILWGAVPVFNALTAFVYFLFLTGRTFRPKTRRPRRFPWMLILALAAWAVTFFTLGTLGDKLAITMENAFFMVIRNIRVLGVIERVEAVVVAVWILTDFVFLSSLLMIVSEILRCVTGAHRRAPFSFPAAGLTAASAFLIARNAFTLQRWSDLVIPAINLLFSTCLIPAVMAVGKLRKKY